VGGFFLFKNIGLVLFLRDLSSLVLVSALVVLLVKEEGMVQEFLIAQRIKLFGNL